MDPALLSLIAASIAFVGTHFLLSHPLRAPLVGALGERAFLAVYSLVALITLGWMGHAFQAVPAPDMAGSGDLGWAVASLLTVLALALFIGSLRGNPALPGAKQASTAAEPRGVFTVTRHPMMWSFALWALAHALLWWSTRTLIVTAAIATLALLGAHLQDRKKEKLVGPAWAEWEARTSYWPRPSRLGTIRPGLWLLAAVLWLVITFAHMPIGGIPAGLWRWL